ncbi:MAG: hypothetical protein M1819_006780 [Sarea resinae]|nr:MAG: hypothetical protein M1819_006780 [Sarea resinae]
MPEVPEQIQDNLANLELNAANSRRAPSSQYGGQRVDRYGGDIPAHPVGARSSTSSSRYSEDPYQSDSYSDAGGYQRQQSDYGSYNGSAATPQRVSSYSQAAFSPFPELRNPSPNVPPTDEEKEATLEQARVAVLNSNDPEMQLAWAQDALAHVEVAIQNELHVSQNQAPRTQTPPVERQLRADAINVVSFLADQHHPRAQFMRGMWLEFGKFDFKVDKKEAFRCYSRAAEKGYARAEYRMGMQFESSNEYAKAIRHYNLGVAAGDSASNYRLGMMTLLGQHGQSQDFAKGVQMIRFAAQTADENAPQGAYVFGMLQARELPQITIPERYLPYDINGARINIEKAAYLGFARAQVKMGSAYELCQLGCEFNPALSLHYNRLAARQGESEADMAISKWFLCGYEGVFDKNEELAFVYAQRAAQSRLATAEFAMGYFYEIGMYVTVDLKAAQSWYSRAAEHGNKDAAGRIEGISRSKTLSRRDHENVAIARIKSQYGSQRGRRPDRFKAQNAPPMPTIADSPIDMPDPATGPSYASYGAPQGPPRSQSTAPYPMEDPNMPPRTSSAFAINPNLRPTSAATINPVPSARPQGSMSPPAGPQRPFSSMDSAVSGGRGRGIPAPRAATGGPGSLGYRQPAGPGFGGPPDSNLPQGNQNQPQPSRLDIGFSAPSNAGPGGRGRMQQPGRSTPGMSSPVPPNSSYPTPAPQARPAPELSRPASAQAQAGRPNSSGRSSRQDAVASPAMSGARPGDQSGRSTPQTRPKPAAKPASQGLPGKGPKTFEEMGVPVQKNDGDCVSDEIPPLEKLAPIY